MLENKIRTILEEFKKAPISILTGEGRTYSIDTALADLRACMKELVGEDRKETIPDFTHKITPVEKIIDFIEFLGREQYNVRGREINKRIDEEFK